jgi:hypothetical protein
VQRHRAGGRHPHVARAFVAESEGVYQPAWTIEDIPAQLDQIRRTDTPWVLPVVPSGHIDHLRRSFAMAKTDHG